MSGPDLLVEKDLFGEAVALPHCDGPVGERFVFPPFTVLDSKSGDWQERKRLWLLTGIRSEVSREHLGSTMASGWIQRGPSEGGSIFDPVLCEVLYQWFCPTGGQVVDPFAGGSVRGIIATALGLDYWGCDLRAEQVTTNQEQARVICRGKVPTWVAGDSMDEVPLAPQADFVFSCPPYGDLEVYSDDPRDLSHMDWEAFRYAYRRIILRALGRLKQDRFAAFVVADFRDPKTGHYRDFVSETVAAFKECGAPLYNEAILLNPVGSAQLRVTRQFNAGRKFVKIHQNVLVFVKGDWRKAAAACRKPGEVAMDGEPEEPSPR